MFKRIVVGVAKVDAALRAADVAADLAQRYEAELHLVTAVDKSATAFDSPGRRQAESFLAGYAEASASGAKNHVLPNDPADAVLLVASEVKADLIVVGNRGMKGAGRVLGSVPNSIAHHAPCSVLIVDTVG
jgi:nucleotide-binding universal stress UspA family protein